MLKFQVDLFPNPDFIVNFTYTFIFAQTTHNAVNLFKFARYWKYVTQNRVKHVMEMKAKSVVIVFNMK